MSDVNFLKARADNLPYGGNPPISAYTIPVTSGLVVASLLSGGAALAAENYSPESLPGRVVGGPTDVDRFVRFGEGAYVDTGVLEILGGTVFFVGKFANPAGNPPAYLGSTNGTLNPGFGFFSPGASVHMHLHTTDGLEVVTVTADAVSWGLYSATIPAAGGGFKLSNHTLDLSTTSSSTSNRVNSGSDTILVGSIHQSADVWSTDLFLAIVYDRVLGAEEIAEMVEWSRQYASDFNINI